MKTANTTIYTSLNSLDGIRQVCVELQEEDTIESFSVKSNIHTDRHGNMTTVYTLTVTSTETSADDIVWTYLHNS
jgi:hypothetical protein